MRLHPVRPLHVLLLAIALPGAPAHEIRTPEQKLAHDLGLVRRVDAKIDECALARSRRLMCLDSARSSPYLTSSEPRFAGIVRSRGGDSSGRRLRAATALGQRRQLPDRAPHLRPVRPGRLPRAASLGYDAAPHPPDLLVAAAPWALLEGRLHVRYDRPHHPHVHRVQPLTLRIARSLVGQYRRHLLQARERRARSDATLAAAGKTSHSYLDACALLLPTRIAQNPARCCISILLCKHICIVCVWPLSSLHACGLSLLLCATQILEAYARRRREVFVESAARTAQEVAPGTEATEELIDVLEDATRSATIGTNTRGRGEPMHTWRTHAHAANPCTRGEPVHTRRLHRGEPHT